MATIQRNYDPMPRLGLDEGVYSVHDVFAFDIGATGRKHSSILGYLSSALSGLLPCASAFAPCVPSVRCDDVPAPIPDPRLPLHNMPSSTPTSASFFPFCVPCVCISVPHPTSAATSTVPYPHLSPIPATHAVHADYHRPCRASKRATLPPSSSSAPTSDPQREPPLRFSAPPLHLCALPRPSPRLGVNDSARAYHVQDECHDLRTIKVLQASIPVHDPTAHPPVSFVPLAKATAVTVDHRIPDGPFGISSGSHGIEYPSRSYCAPAMTHTFSSSSSSTLTDDPPLRHSGFIDYLLSTPRSVPIDSPLRHSGFVAPDFHAYVTGEPRLQIPTSGIPDLCEVHSLHEFGRQLPASVHGAALTSPPNIKDPTGLKDILRDNDCRDAWFASIKDELRSIIVSMDPPLGHLEYDAPGLRGFNGDAFGNLPRPPEQCRVPEVLSTKLIDTDSPFGDLPRPPEHPSDTAQLSIDLCQPTTLVYYVDDILIFNGLSTAYITTLPDYHSPTHEYISSPNNFHGYPDSDDDSDDDSDYDDLPHLMDPDDSDDDMPGLELGLAQAA